MAGGYYETCSLASNLVQRAVDSKHLVITESTVYVTPTGKLYFIGSTTIFSLFIYFSVQIVFRLLSKTYNGLSVKEQMFWNLAFVRGIYGIIGTIGCVHERWFSTLGPDSIDRKTPLSHALLLAHLGFFIFECSAQTYFDYRFKTFSKELHVHHILALVGYSLCIYYDVNHYQACSVFILEMSTPFSCICWCLIKAKMENSKLWKANQLVLVHIFHMRSVLEFMMLYEMIKYREDFFRLPISILINHLGGLIIVAFYLTPYWTYRKTQQLFNPVDFSMKSNKSEKKTS